MSEPKEIKPVKLICGIIAVNEEMAERATAALVRMYGEPDLELGPIPFDSTDYYGKEMGQDLVRKFIAFDELIDPGRLAAIKLATNDLEKEIAVCGGRPVNLDPGYVSESKLVLASAKNFAHRLYLGDGIYGEVTLHFRKGGAIHYEWTFPDYRTDIYKRFFEEVREAYRSQLCCGNGEEI